VVSRRFRWCLSRFLSHGRLSLILERPESRPFEDQVEHHWHHLFRSSSFPLYSNPRPPINTTLYESIPLLEAPSQDPHTSHRTKVQHANPAHLSNQPTALKIEPANSPEYRTITDNIHLRTHSYAIIFFRAESFPRPLIFARDHSSSLAARHGKIMISVSAYTQKRLNLILQIQVLSLIPCARWQSTFPRCHSSSSVFSNATGPNP